MPDTGNDNIDKGLRDRLGDRLVDDFLAAASEVGRSYLTGDEDLVFGFLQRVLAHLRNSGRNYGLIFPKRDRHYRPMFDYFDGDGRIFVIYPGAGSPDQLPIEPAWVVPVESYYEVSERATREIALAFLRVYAHLRFEHPALADPTREASPRPHAGS